MKSRVTKRSIVVHDHKTSISLEQRFWDEICNIAARTGSHKCTLIEGIDERRLHANLSSAIRLYVLEDALARLATAEAKLAEMEVYEQAWLDNKSYRQLATA